MQNSIVDLTGLTTNFIKTLLGFGAMEIRNVDRGEAPFGYASGWSGPGYILFKALVSHSFFSGLLMILAIKVAAKAPKTTFVAGNITGGVIPGWLLSRNLEILLGHPVHFMYVSGTRDFEEARKRPITVVNKIKLETLAQYIARAVSERRLNIDFVAGGAPEGMVIAHRVSEILSSIYGRYVPFVYVRDIRKSGGHGELITGIQNNPFFQKGMRGLCVGQFPGSETNDGTEHVMNALREEGFVPMSLHEASMGGQISDFGSDFFFGMQRPLERNDHLFNPDVDEGVVAEELTNFAHSTIVSVQVLEKEYQLSVPTTACILSYDQPTANQNLRAEGIEFINFITLPELLHTAKQLGTHSSQAVKGFKQFLANPQKWNLDRGIKKREKGGTI